MGDVYLIDLVLRRKGSCYVVVDRTTARCHSNRNTFWVFWRGVLFPVGGFFIERRGLVIAFMSLRQLLHILKSCHFLTSRQLSFPSTRLIDFHRTFLSLKTVVSGVLIQVRNCCNWGIFLVCSSSCFVECWCCTRAACYVLRPPFLPGRKSLLEPELNQCYFGPATFFSLIYIGCATESIEGNSG